ncbi:SCO family protein [Colwellia asteriadis]|uniref:SCO family protein n=1 Tax=Colwellia asteriadis TaxID=517723 RepID=A0ABP3WH47_9GAMM
MTRQLWLTLFIIFVLGFTLKSYLNSTSLTTSETTSAVSRFNSRDTTLFGENNQPVTLFTSQDTRVRILYFGFTRCPDVCPTSLAMLAAALNNISAEKLQQLRPTFISLDPERDAADASYQYAQYFHPMIEGLSAPLPVVTELANHYGVIFKKTALADSTLTYTLDHNSYFYFVNADGTLIKKVPHTFSPEPLVQAINDL